MLEWLGDVTLRLVVILASVALGRSVSITTVRFVAEMAERLDLNYSGLQ